MSFTMKKLSGGRMTKWKGRVASIAPFVAALLVAPGGAEAACRDVVSSGNGVVYANGGSDCTANFSAYYGANTAYASQAGSKLTFTQPDVTIVTNTGTGVYTLAIGGVNIGGAPDGDGASVIAEGNLTVLGSTGNNASRNIRLDGGNTSLSVAGNLFSDRRGAQGYALQTYGGAVSVGGNATFIARASGTALHNSGAGASVDIAGTGTFTSGGVGLLTLDNASVYVGGMASVAAASTALSLGRTATGPYGGSSILLSTTDTTRASAGDTKVVIGAPASVTSTGGNAIVIDNNHGDIDVLIEGTVKAAATGILSQSGAGKTVKIDLAANSVLNGTTAISDTAGNADVIVRAGAAVSAPILLGDGSDSLTLYQYDPTQLLDGGDDVSSADGMVDTLTLSGLTVGVTGAQVVNWENVVVDGGRVSVTDHALTTGSDAGTGLTVQNGGVLDVAGGLALTGNLTNGATVTSQDGVAGDRLEVSGSYTGGGRYEIDTVLGNDGSATDILVIAGATSGTTTLVVNNIGGTGAATTTGILVVQTTDFTGSFVLQGGSVSAGDYTYTLAQGSEGWYLVAAEPPATGSIHEALPAALFARLPTLEQRVGQRQWLGRDSARVGVVEPARGAWMRVWGDKSEIRPESSTSGITADRSDWGLQLGYDHPLERGDAGQWVLGVTLQAGHSSTAVTTAEGAGNIKADGLGLGVTGTWYGDNGLYVDLQGQVNRLKTDVTFDGATLLDGKGLTATAVGAEIGWRKAISANSALVPQAQLTWSHISGGSFTDDQGALVDMGDNDQLIGRIGVAWEYEYSEGWLFGDRATSSEVNHREKVYVIGNLLHNFSGDTTVTVDGLALTQTNAATWAEIGVGGSYLWDGNKTVYTEMSYRRAMDGGDAEGLAATVGFRMKF